MTDPEKAACTVASWARDGEEVEAFASWGRELEVRVFQGEVEHLVSAESAGIGVRVVKGGRQGFAYCGNLEGGEAELVALLEEARDNARFATFDEYAGIASPDGVMPADLDLYRDGVSETPTAQKVELALSLDRALRSADPRIRQVESSNYADSQWVSTIASSTGIMASSRGTGAYLFAYAIAEENGDTRTGGGYSVGREPGELDVDEAAADAAFRSTRLLGAVKPSSATVTVVLDSRVAASFLSVIAGTLSGEAVEKGRSLFKGRLGEQVADPALSLVEDPTDPDAYLASRFDAEGLATRRTVLIDGGVLRAFLYDSYSARRAGTSSTGSAVRAGFASTPGVGFRAVSVVPGASSAEEIISSVDRGLLVTSVTGLHSGVNPVSGDFSVGAEGLLIEGGALASPVKEATVASTIQRMLLSIRAVGSELERLPGPAAGVTLAIDDLSLSGR